MIIARSGHEYQVGFSHIVLFSVFGQGGHLPGRMQRLEWLHGLESTRSAFQIAQTSGPNNAVKLTIRWLARQQNALHILDIAKDKLKLREWCLARKDWKRFELQIEVCEWAITEIKATDLGLKEKQRITTAIKKEIDGLAKSRVAIPCPAAY